MYATTITRTGALVLAGAAFLSLAVAGPAGAIPEPPPSPQAVQYTDLRSCALTRIGEQFVRCDNLTGAGVPAPSWIPVQQ
jgi:hypothetical protein